MSRAVRCSGSHGWTTCGRGLRAYMNRADSLNTLPPQKTPPGHRLGSARYHTPATRPILAIKPLKTLSILTAPMRVTVARLLLHGRNGKLRQVDDSGAIWDS